MNPFVSKLQGKRRRKAFLVVILGGSPDEVAVVVKSRLAEETAGDGDGPFLVYFLKIDTDDREVEGIDAFVSLAVTLDDCDAMDATPSSYSPTVRAIYREHREVVRDSAKDPGSGTRRFVTQVGFELGRDRVIEGLNGALRALESQGAEEVVVLLLSGTGGGAGSALQILLSGRVLCDPEARSLLEANVSPHLIREIVSFAMEPVVHVESVDDLAKNRIEGNAYAFRLEREKLKHEGRSPDYCLHFGASSRGARHETVRAMSRNLGECVFEYCRNHDWLGARLTNTFGQNRAPYGGADVAERRQRVERSDSEEGSALGRAGVVDDRTKSRAPWHSLDAEDPLPRQSFGRPRRDEAQEPENEEPTYHYVPFVGRVPVRKELNGSQPPKTDGEQLDEGPN
jgi:hypothetical protein